MIINLINSIGQRKVSKIIFFFSLVLYFSCFISQVGIAGIAGISLWLGILLMAAPIGFFSLSAQQSKDYRFFCLVVQIIIMILNFILFFMKVPDVMFILTIFQTIASFIFYLFVAKKKSVRNNAKNNKLPSKNKIVKQNDDINKK